ncbi:hypothetical protein B0H14DRAFT_2948689 [Mycena olivaceomarginata]|nr:hypothetical protein B0H14DRAFT_2948689 [Mycena olivaceomarginata]
MSLKHPNSAAVQEDKGRTGKKSIPWRQRETDSCCSLTSLTAISTSRCWIKRSSEEMGGPQEAAGFPRRSRCSSSTRRSSRLAFALFIFDASLESLGGSRCSSPNSFLISSISCLKIPTTMSRSRSMVWIRSLSLSGRQLKLVFLAAGRSCGLGRSTTRPLCGLLESRPTVPRVVGVGSCRHYCGDLAILDGTRTAINRSALRRGGSGTASRRAGRHGQGWRSAKEGRRRKGTARTARGTRSGYVQSGGGANRGDGVAKATKVGEGGEGGVGWHERRDERWRGRMTGARR